MEAKTFFKVIFCEAMQKYLKSVITKYSQMKWYAMLTHWFRARFIGIVLSISNLNPVFVFPSEVTACNSSGTSSLYICFALLTLTSQHYLR